MAKLPSCALTALLNNECWPHARRRNLMCTKLRTVHLCHQLGALCATDGVLPPVLFLLLRPGSPARRQSWQAGGQIPRPSPGNAPVLRGALALVLRSVGAADARCNYCALAADPAQQ